MEPTWVYLSPWRQWLIWLPVCLLLPMASFTGCGTSHLGDKPNLRLATTTSTRDSGLLEQLLAPFEAQQQVKVDVIAAGTGKALKLGELGDVDVVFVHARQAEDAFMAAGHGTRHEAVMYNTFELLGPSDDPAKVRGLKASAALQRIAVGGFAFVGRGDDSGTHKRELLLWHSGGGLPIWPNYQESGQGMGATLVIADETSAYVLSDRGTFLNFQEKIDLEPLAAPSPELHNPYGVMVVNPEKHPDVRGQLADAFVDYLISPAAQQTIADYRLAGEVLFVPLRLTKQQSSVSSSQQEP